MTAMRLTASFICVSALTSRAAHYSEFRKAYLPELAQPSNRLVRLNQKKKLITPSWNGVKPHSLLYAADSERDNLLILG